MKLPKILLTVFLVAVGLFFILTFSIGGLIDRAVDESTQPYKQMINKKVIVDKDTLTVIDYSALKDEIILSNGKIVALKYAQLNTVK